MSFLLDVADPSIHFRARQCRNNSGPTPSLSSSPSKPAATAAAASSISPATATTMNTISGTATKTPLKQNLFSSILPPMSGNATLPTTSMLSAMSRMIRTTSSSSISSVASFSSSPPTSSWSSPNTPEAANISDPFNVAAKAYNNGYSTLSATNASTTQRPSGAGIATSLSPWMMPSVCDDDQMNKLVSFQL
ncbi:hypothetical protein BGZ58_000473 [Dissophora ornata]|nr:hypothetical protein BGZ58_000473 [Dissophora ornata]